MKSTIEFMLVPPLSVLLFAALGCGQPAAISRKEGDKLMPATLEITIGSPAFKANGAISKQYTGEGKNISPPLQWSGVPAETKELALIVDDPDAPMAEPFVHWVIYGIPAGETGLPEGVPDKETLDSGAKQGRNDFGTTGWSGPMPPKGHGTHHYHFKLYALKAPLNLPPGQKKKELLQAMKDQVIAGGELIGTYAR
jgi:Raf kinase inhibitor-like YbhB/YbcL family protein